MPTFEEMYTFLKNHYLHSRFEDSPHRKDFPEYPSIVTWSHWEWLREMGSGIISQYESRTGTVIHYDINLTITNPDEPPGQIQRKAGHLTHLF